VYAAHFAAALAIKESAPKVPVAALLVGVFIPDFIWIALAAIGVEPADPSAYFDDWSHSLCSVGIEATFFALCFYREGISVWVPIWLATFSHFILDWPIPPGPSAVAADRYPAPRGIARTMWRAEDAWRDVLSKTTLKDIVGIGNVEVPAEHRRRAQIWLRSEKG
jgi:hypothetical protein